MCAAGESRISEAVVIFAHTTLVHAEQFMPKALGEFGLAKNSDITHKVLEVINEALEPLKVKDIWKVVHQDLENIQKLGEILRNLMEADKIQSIPDMGFLPKKKAIDESVSKYVDYSLLTEEERNMKI
jgi:hypothetical protein